MTDAFGPYGYGPPPQPGIVPLRPLELGDLFSGAVRYVRANPAATLGVAAVVSVVVSVIQAIIQLVAPIPTDVQPDQIQEFLTASLTSLAVTLVGSIVTVVAVSVAGGLLVVVLSRSVLGRTTSLAEAWTMVRSRVAGLVGVSLLAGLIALTIIAVGVGVALLVVIAGGASGGAILVAIVLFIAAIVATVYVSVLLTMATAAYVLEHTGVVAALQRSRQLVQGSWWRIFAILLLTGIMAGAVSLVIALPFAGVAGVGALAAGTPTTSTVVLTLISGIISGTLTTPFTVGVTNLLYVDQRIRRERFDIALARAAAEGTEPGQLS